MKTLLFNNSPIMDANNESIIFTTIYKTDKNIHGIDDNGKEISLIDVVDINKFTLADGEKWDPDPNIKPIDNSILELEEYVLDLEFRLAINELDV